MRKNRRREVGQAVALFALAMFVLLAFGALAIDGGRLYVESRRTQNAVDNAALAAARAMCLGENHTTAALQLANENGYDNDGVGDIVTVNNPPTSGPHSGDSEYIEVIIVSNFAGSLIQFFREGGLQVTVRAVGQCSPGAGEGHPALFAISETCPHTILWSGSLNSVEGGMHSNNDIEVGGQDNNLIGIATYVDTISADPDKITYDPPPPDNPLVSEVLEDPLLFELADYAPGGSRAAYAQGMGQYRYCDCKMDIGWLEDNHYYDSGTGILQDGLYYATGNIELSNSDMIGNAVTLVAEKELFLNGSNQNFSYYMDHLLGFAGKQFEIPGNACGSAILSLSGSNNIYEGLLYSPGGEIYVAGSDIQVTGGFIGNTIALADSNLNLSLTNLAEYAPAGPGTIEITE